jgi:AcrR family transcriptional regulator
VPRIWADTIDSHRQQVHDAILDATAGLIAEHGPMSVAMSAIAERAGIGRATLYKYFPDVEAILLAWHARDFADHLERLRELTESESVTLDDIAEFVRAQRRHHPRHKGADLVGSLAHTLAGAAPSIQDTIERDATKALTALMKRLVDRKEVRNDRPPRLLAQWLMHAIHAPAELDDAAVAELVVDSLAPRTAKKERTARRR